MDQPSNIEIDFVERDDTVVVVVRGEVDLYGAPEFTAWLARAGACTAPSIVIDLDRVSFMDSAGVHALLQFSSSQRKLARLALTPGSLQVQRLLEATGMRRFMSFVPSPGI